uniref:D-box binding PAR bZIP transcription factor n=1 Tax=Leptobrachium leishanense TaxID=445787 RepID=A0A8C5WCT9_9ANUR
MARPTTQLAGSEKLQGQQLHPTPPLGMPGAGMVSLKSLLQGPIKGQDRRAKELSNCQMTPESRDSPSPVDPETVEVMMNFDPDPADLALSSVPGHETFDPRKHRFSEEDLKPQPIMKKARKIQVPDEQKDEKYWNRRYKNNEAAKRSRDARRLKENQITVRAAFLEKENSVLRQEGPRRVVNRPTDRIRKAAAKLPI